jgi:hypothetical protein
MASGATHSGNAPATLVRGWLHDLQAGNRYTIDEIHIFRIRNGQLVEHRHAFDTMSLIRQLRGEGEGPSSGGAAVGRSTGQTEAKTAR